eukprot:GHRR01007247.1.p1 GENE.GHRR01007247.1~~GHRR01007247.1.p1  ORF type:complete len:304 (+),score=96.61 GHRR01007247.1:118-912(+)
MAFTSHAAPIKAVAFGSAKRPAAQKLAVHCQAAAAAETAETQRPQRPTVHNQPPPETYAIVEVGGKQLFVEPGKWYVCNRLQVDVGDKIRLGRVLALKQGDNFTVGRPYLENVNIEAEVLEELRGPKVGALGVRRRCCICISCSSAVGSSQNINEAGVLEDLRGPRRQQLGFAMGVANGVQMLRAAQFQYVPYTGRGSSTTTTSACRLLQEPKGGAGCAKLCLIYSDVLHLSYANSTELSRPWQRLAAAGDCIAAQLQASGNVA